MDVLNVYQTDGRLQLRQQLCVLKLSHYISKRVISASQTTSGQIISESAHMRGINLKNCSQQPQVLH